MLRLDGRALLDFCSNDYLALSDDPEVVEAAREAAARHGAGARASRLVTGNHALLEELEAELADFKGTQAALVFPTGYQANLGLISALVEPGDAVFADRLAHSCLVDGVRLSGARLRVWPHNNIDKLRSLLAHATEAPARWILADAVYSMDGDLAPLPELLALTEEFDATLILDDAHGTGVLGERGRGTAEHFSIQPSDWPERLLLVATLSKALGAQGGAVLGPALLREELVNRARTFIYTTGLAPPAAGAALAGLRIVRREPQRVRELSRRTELVRARLRELAIPAGAPSAAPIVPVLLGEASAAVAASRKLEERGIAVLPIRPPTVPKGSSRLRMTVTLHHDEEQCLRACTEIARAVSPTPTIEETI